MEIPSELQYLTQRELLDIARIQLGRHLHPGATREQIFDLLRCKQPEPPMPSNPIDSMREEIIAHIQLYENQLSLPCHGDCRKHADALVVQRYIELSRDTKIHVDLDDLTTDSPGGSERGTQTHGN